ncbi:hypothetical protein EON67_05050 [archaeon]|nr:MAG: hypothetical protein EON67_05050 [archaeon]
MLHCVHARCLIPPASRWYVSGGSARAGDSLAGPALHHLCPAAAARDGGASVCTHPSCHSFGIRTARGGCCMSAIALLPLLLLPAQA